MMKYAPSKTYLYGPTDERMWIYDYGQGYSIETFTLRGLNNEVLREYQVTNGNAEGHWSWLKDYIYRGDDWSLHEPQSWNLYTYVKNNPVNATEPNGKVTSPGQRVSRSASFHMPDPTTPPNLDQADVPEVIANSGVNPGAIFRVREMMTQDRGSSAQETSMLDAAVSAAKTHVKDVLQDFAQKVGLKHEKLRSL